MDLRNKSIENFLEILKADETGQRLGIGAMAGRVSCERNVINIWLKSHGKAITDTLQRADPLTYSMQVYFKKMKHYFLTT